MAPWIAIWKCRYRVETGLHMITKLGLSANGVKADNGLAFRAGPLISILNDAWRGLNGICLGLNDAWRGLEGLRGQMLGFAITLLSVSNDIPGLAVNVVVPPTQRDDCHGDMNWSDFAVFDVDLVDVEHLNLFRLPSALDPQLLS